MEIDHDIQREELIGEALIREVIVQELQQELPEASPAPTLELSAPLLSEADQRLATQVGRMVRIGGDVLNNDPEFQDAVDSVLRSESSMAEKFKQLYNTVFQHEEITWQRITVVLYMAGRMAVKVTEDCMPTLVTDIFKLMVEFVKTKLLVWVRSHGGWIGSLPVLCTYVQVVAPMSPHTTMHILIFITGLAFGSIITWKLARGS